MTKRTEAEAARRRANILLLKAEAALRLYQRKPTTQTRKNWLDAIERRQIAENKAKRLEALAKEEAEG